MFPVVLLALTLQSPATAPVTPPAKARTPATMATAPARKTPPPRPRSYTVTAYQGDVLPTPSGSKG